MTVKNINKSSEKLDTGNSINKMTSISNVAKDISNIVKDISSKNINKKE